MSDAENSAAYSQRTRFQTWWRLLTVVVTIATVALALYLLDWSALRAAITRISAGAIVGCVALCLLTHGLIALRWAVMVAPASDRPRFSGMLMSLHASLFNLVTPAALGADLYRVLNTRRDQSRARVAGLVLFERALGVWAQSTLYVLALAIAWSVAVAGASEAGAGSLVMVYAAVPFGAIAVAGVIAAMGGARLVLRLLVSRQDRISAAIVLLRTEIEQTTPRLVLLALLSVAAVFTWVTAALVLAKGAGMNDLLPQLTMVTILTEFARLAPVSVQGIGVREATFSGLVRLGGGSAEAGFVVCTLLYALNYLVVASVGFAAAAVLSGSGGAR